MFAMAVTAVTFCVRTSWPEVRSPCSWNAGPADMLAEALNACVQSDYTAAMDELDHEASTSLLFDD